MLGRRPLGTTRGEIDGHLCIDDYQLLVSNATGIPLAAQEPRGHSDRQFLLRVDARGLGYKPDLGVHRQS